MDDFGKLVSLLGGWSVILLACIAWVSKLVTERVLSRWRRDEQSQIALLKEQLADNRLVLQAAVGSHTSGHDAFQQKRLEAVGRVWPAVLHLRNELSIPVFFFGTLAPEEYDRASSDSESIRATISILDEGLINRVVLDTSKIEEDRPYLGETLWLRFFVYRAFLGRLAVLIIEGKRNGHIPDWRQDNGVRQLLSAVGPPELSLEVLESGFSMTAINRAVNLLESSILEEASLIASGQRSAIESYENARQMREALSNEKAWGV